MIDNEKLINRPIMISIIVPMYNGAQYISKCIDSLISQTLKDIQIILVDDGSVDNTKSICEDYAQRDNRIEYYHKENGGSATARNLGLEHAKGEYIGFVDSDDYVESNMFELMYQAAKDNCADIVFNPMYDVANKDKYCFTWPTPGLYNREEMINKIFPELLPHPNENGTFRSFDWGNWSKIIRRDVVYYNHIRYANRSRRCEDLCFAFECTVHADNYLIMESAKLYHYVASETSKSRNYTKNMWHSIRNLMCYLKEVCSKIDYDFSEAVEYCILYFCTITIKNEVFGGQRKGRMDRIKEILDDELCKKCLYLGEIKQYNKEYTEIFNAMSTGQAKKVYKVYKWWAFKKKHVAPVLKWLR